MGESDVRFQKKHVRNDKKDLETQDKDTKCFAKFVLLRLFFVFIFLESDNWWTIVLIFLGLLLICF